MAQLHLVPPLPSAEMPPHDPCLDAFLGQLDYICRSLRRLGTAPSEVEDLAQEVFLVLRQTWPDYDPARPIRPYLFGIAFRIASAHRRKRKRERELPYPIIDVEDRSARPDLMLQAKQARAVVLASLEQIPLPRRAVLVLHDIDEIPIREVAAALSVPLFTAYSRLRKARQELEVAVRRLLKEAGR